MKHFIVGVSILLGCCCIGTSWARVEAPDTSVRDWGIDVELPLGLSYAEEVGSGEPWKGSLGTGLGLNFSYAVAPDFWLRTGISQQVGYTNRRVVHPYPYVMDMDVLLSTQSTRLSARIDYSLEKSLRNAPLIYVGAGVFADIVHWGKAKKKLYYVGDFETDEVNVEDSFSDPVPGFQVFIGTRGRIIRLELIHWQDVKTFDIPTVPIGNQRRTFFGMNVAVYLYRHAGR